MTTDGQSSASGHCLCGLQDTSPILPHEPPLNNVGSTQQHSNMIPILCNLTSTILPNSSEAALWCGPGIVASIEVKQRCGIGMGIVCDDCGDLPRRQLSSLNRRPSSKGPYPTVIPRISRNYCYSGKNVYRVSLKCVGKKAQGRKVNVFDVTFLTSADVRKQNP